MMIDYNAEKEKLDKKLILLSLSRFAFGSTNVEEFLDYETKEHTNEFLSDEDITNFVLENCNENKEQMDKTFIESEDAQELVEEKITISQAKSACYQVFKYFESNNELIAKDIDINAITPVANTTAPIPPYLT